MQENNLRFKTFIAKLLIARLTEDRQVPVITALIDFNKENAKGKEKEKFSKFIDRLTTDQLKRIAGY